MAGNIVERVDDRVKIQHALISVSDKTGLESLVTGVLAANPAVRIFSTGGTFARIRETLGQGWERNLTQVSSYTGQPETQGGLVKTLDFKIYLGLLTETYNEAHQGDLERTGAVAIDLVVCNLYPFAQTVAQAEVTVEKARSNIDIGGPCMIRASAKNYLRVATVVDPGAYPDLIAKLEAGAGRLDLATRFALAKKAFAHTAAYDQAIGAYLADTPTDAMMNCYQLETKG